MVDLDLITMDREFDGEDVKKACKAYGVHFLDPTRIFERSDETDTIEWMYREGKRFHVTKTETDDNTPTRKQVYLPKQSNADEDDSFSEVWKEMCGEWELGNARPLHGLADPHRRRGQFRTASRRQGIFASRSSGTRSTPFGLALAVRLASRWPAQCLLRHPSPRRQSLSILPVRLFNRQIGSGRDEMRPRGPRRKRSRSTTPGRLVRRFTTVGGV